MRTDLGASLPPVPRVRKPKPSLEECGVLEAARRAKHDADAAEARKLSAAVEWCRLHEVSDVEDAETWGQTPVPLGGEGVPLIATGCVAEFAAVIGTSTGGGRYYLTDALELAHRLPLLYARVQAGTLPAWKARRIAGQTTDMSLTAVTALDARIAPLAAALSAKAAEQMVAETIGALMPELAQCIVDADHTQHVNVLLHQVSFLGTAAIHGSLDYADALDLQAALDHEAQLLLESGSTKNLDARRAEALGRLARGQATGPGREVVVYVHLPAEPAPTASVETSAGNRTLSIEQVKTWCAGTGTRVTIKPVIDLNQRLATSAYETPEKIREHVQLRDGTCIFVFCEKPARGTQADHSRPYDPDGPPDQTSTDNLGSLCQHHHNLKTHAGWSYTALLPGIYLWRSPHGYLYLRDRYGTRELTPPPVPGPG
jgi:hypothetical protein